MMLARSVVSARAPATAAHAETRANVRAGFAPSRSHRSGARATRGRERRPRAIEGDVVATIASANGGLETARAALGVATVALIMFQGPKGDGVVNSLNEGRVFGSAAKAKSAVDYVTYALIGGFIAMSAVLAASG